MRSSIPLTGKLLFVCAVLAMQILRPSDVQAEPITFGFEAVITGIADGIPFETGVDFAVDDVVTGRFTFEPVAGDGGNPLIFAQPHAISVEVNGAILSVDDLSGRTFNNTAVVDNPMFNDLVDHLSLGGPTVVPEPTTFPGGEPMTWGIRLDFFGTKDLMDTASLPADLSVWNGFQLERSLGVSFDGEGGGAVGIDAQIGDFYLVPEPSTGVSASVLLIMLWRIYRRGVN